MLSIRSLARSAPRVTSQLSRSAFRQPAARQSSLLRSAWKPASTQCISPFSTSTARAQANGESDEELVAKLESEIEAENEFKEADSTPKSITEFIEHGPFELHDTPGSEEVMLTRKFGNETIHVTFSIADFNVDPENEFEDRAVEDEEMDSQSKQPEQAEANDDGYGDEQQSSFPARVSVIIEKPGKGALAVETIAQDGMIVIENVYYYADAAHAYAKTAEKAHERQDMYVGPPFANLDEDLQVLMERYLDERGINSALAIFVPDYIDMKEQKEYLGWLSRVKGFVAA